MNLHEYQAKELLLKFKLPILKGKIYFNKIENLDEDLENFRGPPWVVKAQIHAGGRGAGHFKNSSNQNKKQAGVQIVKNNDDLINIANSMLGNTLITKQTGEMGKKVNRVYIEEGCKIIKEFYLGLIIDRKSSNLMLMVSAEGGIDIEEVAQKYPNKFYSILFPNLDQIHVDESLQTKLEINKDQFKKLTSIIEKLITAFKALDASSIEINPLVLNDKDDLILLDAKITLDDNALFRHPELLNLKDLSEENQLELQASENGMNYVKLNGSIGCMVNGAGLAMATMDIIKLFGHEPANFLDLGGTANKERAIEGFKIIQSDPNVKSVLINIFGGIIRCDMIASGIEEAIKELDFKLPLVVRFQGTNAKEGRDIINRSSYNITSLDDLAEAAKKAVDLAT